METQKSPVYVAHLATISALGIAAETVVRLWSVDKRLTTDLRNRLMSNIKNLEKQMAELSCAIIESNSETIQKALSRIRNENESNAGVLVIDGEEISGKKNMIKALEKESHQDTVQISSAYRKMQDMLRTIYRRLENL